MLCPFCKYKDSQVIDSRSCEDGAVIRRRRRCPSCGARFTTYEKVALTMPLVIKRSTHRKVPYSQEKLIKSLQIALRKRPVSPEDLEMAIERIEQKIRSYGEKEIESKVIGEYVLEELEKLDKIAYMRFASVYFNYESAEDFASALEKLGIVSKSK